MGVVPTAFALFKAKRFIADGCALQKSRNQKGIREARKSCADSCCALCKPRSPRGASKPRGPVLTVALCFLLTVITRKLLTDLISNPDTTNILTMAAAQIAGHKRTRSSTEPEVVAAEATPNVTPKASGSATAASKHVLIMHLNSLLDCKDATISTIRNTMAEAFANRHLPEPTDEAILCAFSKSPIVFEILAHLGIPNISQEEHDRVIEAYPRIYSLQGQPRIERAFGAVEFLEEVKRRGNISLAVMSNDPQRAAELLGTLGMGELVETVLTHNPLITVHVALLTQPVPLYSVQTNTPV
jgi:hypothetical protein